ncbi:MAG: metalloregulator ArsR/SmtB family transcription factor [Oscillospiraceae bacterium]
MYNKGKIDRDVKKMMDDKEKCSCCAAHAQTVSQAKSSMPTDKEISGISAFFKVLGDPTRIRLMCVLEKGELCVCDLAVALDMTKSAISHQLSGLRSAKLVKSRREGKNIYYSVDDDHVREVLTLAYTHIRHSEQDNSDKCDG